MEMQKCAMKTQFWESFPALEQNTQHKQFQIKAPNLENVLNRKEKDCKIPQGTRHHHCINQRRDMHRNDVNNPPTQGSRPTWSRSTSCLSFLNIDLIYRYTQEPQQTTHPKYFWGFCVKMTEIFKNQMESYGCVRPSSSKGKLGASEESVVWDTWRDDERQDEQLRLIYNMWQP